MVQFLLIGVILPLACFFLLQAEQDLGPALLLRYTDTKVTEGRVVAVAPSTATVEYGTPGGKLVHAFDVNKELSAALQNQPHVRIRFATLDPQVAVVEGQSLAVTDGIGFLVAGMVFLVAGLAAGLAIWRTPENRKRLPG